MLFGTVNVLEGYVFVCLVLKLEVAEFSETLDLSTKLHGATSHNCKLHIHRCNSFRPHRMTAFPWWLSMHKREQLTPFVNLNRRSPLTPLKPNDPYRGHTSTLTSKRCILYIYSTNVGTEYFKHGIYTPFFTLQNAVCFVILTYLVPVLFTFYIQVC